MRTLTRARYKRKVAVPTGRKLLPVQQFDMRGLDQSTPHDIMQDYHSPYLRNARMLAREDAERKVAIRSRKGQGYYSVPIGEASHVTQTSVTGAADQTINTVHWSAQDFTTVGTGRLTKVELNLKNPSGAIGNVIVQVHTDDSGTPGDVIATSSCQGSDITSSYAYVVFRFIDAPALSDATKYWIVAHLQEGGENHYHWSSTTNTTTGLETNNSGATWSALSASLNFKVYLSTDGGVKGVTRHYPTSGSNLTIFAHSQNVYKINDGTGATTSIVGSLSSSATDYYFDFSNDLTYFVNGIDVPKYTDGSTATTVPGSPGVSTLLCFHKNRLFLVPASDPTRINFSDVGDYGTWGATSFLYVPAPKVSDPIVRMISFQDNLVIYTRNSKWVLHGSDLSTFTLKQSIGKKGAAGTRAIGADENYIYALADDGIYRWNGSSDEKISDRVQPTVEAIGDPTKAHARVWRDQVRFYYSSPGASTNDACLIWDKVYEEWFLDTDTPIGATTVLFKDGNRLVEGSTRVGAVYYGEEEDNLLGKPIDFQYWTKYFAFGNAAAKKQIRRLYPLFRAQDAPFEVDVQIDKDFRNQPVSYSIDTQGEGATWGQFEWGDGTTWGSTSLVDPRLTIAGQAVYFQIRFVQNGADTPVEILGYMMYPRIKRPK